MSELINNSTKRKELLKHLILQLHDGIAPEDVKKQLISLMSKVPYGEVVEVEQELINEGLPEAEVLKLCDIHTKALEGVIDLDSAKPAPAGHPVDVFLKENAELLIVVSELEETYKEVSTVANSEQIASLILKMRGAFNKLMDVDKHYKRKENLLFPYLEKLGITGPPKVMWGKHDETRELLKGAIEALSVEGAIEPEEAQAVVEFALKPASNAVADMTMKEEQILLPMCMDRLTDLEWYEISKQTLEYGFCLYDPQEEWKPEGVSDSIEIHGDDDTVNLPSGSLSVAEIKAILNTVPFDMTFVDKNDKVKYFTQGDERIFSRSRAILKRDVRMCHPPSSVNIVDKIIDDFRSGRESRAPFWINLHGKFIHIEYFALRDDNGEYLGTLEVSQDLTNARSLEGEQRLLTYAGKNENGK